jgi:hypothetical protein
MTPTEIVRHWVQRHQTGYFDQLTFFRIQGLPIPASYLET